MPALPSDLQIRRARDGDLPEMARIHHASFPGVSLTLEDRISYFRNDPRLPLEDHWVCERRGRLTGMFALYNFRMHRGRTIVPLGGIGMVAVAPEARRQKIAYWMMLRAVQIMDQNGLVLSALYPFNHSFYRRLGWGPVGRTTLYSFPPSALPNYPEKTQVQFVSSYENQVAVMDCYEKFAADCNGLLQRDEPVWFERIFKNHLCYAWFNPKDEVEGYVIFDYQPLPQDIHLTAVDLKVSDFVWQSEEALRGLIGFLAAQSDQARSVLLPDQSGLPFDQCVTDPRMAEGRHNWLIGAETAIVGNNLMGRIVNLRRTLALTRMGNATGRITFKIADQLNPANEEEITVEFESGKADFPKAVGKGLTLKADIATLSSIYWGALKWQDAKRFGMVELEGEGDSSHLNRLFNFPKPMCYDNF